MSGSPRSARIAIIGVGNEFRHDDGAAWAVIARLRERADGRPCPRERSCRCATEIRGG